VKWLLSEPLIKCYYLCCVCHGRLRRRAERNPELNQQLGRHVFGVAAIGFGVTGLLWHDFSDWQQVKVFGSFPFREMLVETISVLEIFAGVAIQWSRTARIGACILGTVYLFFALMWVPLIAQKPWIYARWGNFFEQYSMVSGAIVVYGSFATQPTTQMRMLRFGYYSFGVCVISFTLGQLFYLPATADFVPKWIPPGGMFWAIATTIAFALAAAALLSGRMALLASRLLTIMILGFGILVWLPGPLSDAHTNQVGNFENLGIAAAAWIVADLLARKSRASAGSSLVDAAHAHGSNG
jgi:uncharacterized membrane protein YphA (DoxX/SURF4 family)